MKSVLHISNDYSGSTVYKNLVQELDELGIKQIVYHPLRDLNRVGVNSVELTVSNSEIIYSPILNWHVDRVFYPYKIYKVYKDIQKRVDFSKIDLIHAHTWYSDGGVAYLLSKEYNIPFVCAIRSTDLNVFHEKLFYLRPFGLKIIKAAKSFFLISESYKDKLLNEPSLKKVKATLNSKIHVVPNGIDQYWLENTFNSKNDNAEDELSHRVDLIYVGTFIPRKHLLLIQQAVIAINKEFAELSVHLNIVGGGGKHEKRVLELVKQFPCYFTYHGKIFDKDVLRDLYRKCNFFVMPSSSETFGLVYVEAMTQGLPILYTRGEGIDGFYSDNIGEKISISTVDEVKSKIIKMIENKNNYSIPLDLIEKNHNWAEIAKKYIDIYRD